tara:strand:+ start:2435 stop:2641 length:207 start_codon:yes stop_codon:yes gene_type:complete
LSTNEFNSLFLIVFFEMNVVNFKFIEEKSTTINEEKYWSFQVNSHIENSFLPSKYFFGISMNKYEHSC